jgi:hypothetical protein
MDATEEHTQTRTGASWLFDRLGRRESYHINRETFLRLLEDHRRESIGEAYRRLEAMQRIIPLRHQPAFMEAKGAIYALLSAKETERAA